MVLEFLESIKAARQGFEAAARGCLVIGLIFSVAAVLVVAFVPGWFGLIAVLPALVAILFFAIGSYMLLGLRG